MIRKINHGTTPITTIGRVDVIEIKINEIISFLNKKKYNLLSSCPECGNKLYQNGNDYDCINSKCSVKFLRMHK